MSENIQYQGYRLISWVIMDDLTTQHAHWMRARGSPKIRSAGGSQSRDPPRRTGGPHSSTSRNMVGPAHQLAPATRAADLSQLRAFYTWARRFEHRADDPTIRLDPHVSRKGFQGPLGKPTLTGSLQVLPEDLRRGVALGAYAGLRAAETAALAWTDIDLDTRRARIVGKARKPASSRSGSP